MKPHEPRFHGTAVPARRPYSFCSGASLVLLVSACTTLGQSSDRGPTDLDAQAPVVAAPSQSAPDDLASTRTIGAARSSTVGRAPVTSGRRAPGPRRMTLPPGFTAPVPQEATEASNLGPPDATSQSLIDGDGENSAAASASIAGPKPKLEPLASYANRPYRLRGRKYRPMTELKPFKQRGVASWYGKPFHGRRTAIGERYNMHAMSAAHPTLPLPSYVRVTNLKSGTSVIVRVNDRGPFAHDRVIDLSHAAAKELGMVDGGVAAVELSLIVPEPAGTAMTAPIADVSR